MRLLQKTFIPTLAFIAVALAVVPKPTLAQTDEIQVYDAEIEEQGKFNVMVHNNFTPIGRKIADFPGGIIPNHSDNGAVEWAWGVKDYLCRIHDYSFFRSDEKCDSDKGDYI